MKVEREAARHKEAEGTEKMEKPKSQGEGVPRETTEPGNHCFSCKDYRLRALGVTSGQHPACTLQGSSNAGRGQKGENRR